MVRPNAWLSLQHNDDRVFGAYTLELLCYYETNKQTCDLLLPKVIIQNSSNTPCCMKWSIIPRSTNFVNLTCFICWCSPLLEFPNHFACLTIVLWPYRVMILSQLSQNAGPMMAKCWANVANVGPPFASIGVAFCFSWGFCTDVCLVLNM